MLTQLCIHNYAIVERLDIDLPDGLIAVTGETGAGKSIILGALGLAIGDRGDRELVRQGARRADISAVFDISRLQGAHDWLQAQELDHPEGERSCVLRRSINSEGRSRAWINGIPVNLQILKQAGEMLIDIHSQHEHQSLLDRRSHQRLLDDFGGHQDLARQVRDTARRWRETTQQLKQLEAAALSQSAHFDLIRYQVEELDTLGLQDDELNQLQEQYQQLSHADDTLAGVQLALNLLDEGEDHNILTGLHQVQSELLRLKLPATLLDNLNELTSSASIQLEEAASELRRHIDSIDRDPETLERINQRLADIHQMARKHRVSAEALSAHHQALRQQLGDAEQSDGQREALRQQGASLQAEYLEQAGRLSRLRRDAAVVLAEQISSQLARLGMAQAQLEVALHEQDSERPQSDGLESVEFLVSTNPGQPARPLVKIASGGELSRISLAIQVITAMTSETPCLVFDEVDVGIGGAVARSVGQLLRQLGERSQVLCVTHQPLVASLAHHHLHVSKHGTDQHYSGTRISALDSEAKVLEVARMLGGEDAGQAFSEQSLAHARALVSEAQ